MKVHIAYQILNFRTRQKKIYHWSVRGGNFSRYSLNRNTLLFTYLPRLRFVEHSPTFTLPSKNGWQSKSVYLWIIYFLVIRNRFHKLIRPGQQIACSQSLMRRNSFLKTPGGIRSKHTLKRLFTQFILLFCSASQRKKKPLIVNWIKYKSTFQLKQLFSQVDFCIVSANTSTNSYFQSKAVTAGCWKFHWSEQTFFHP